MHVLSLFAMACYCCLHTYCYYCMLRQTTTQLLHTYYYMVHTYYCMLHALPRLVHVELTGHGLHRLGAVAQPLLEDRQLLGHLGTGLPCEDVLELDVQLVL